MGNYIISKYGHLTILYKVTNIIILLVKNEIFGLRYKYDDRNKQSCILMINI